MRQKLLKLFVVLSMVLVPNIKAACTYVEQADLNKEVANIQIKYETKTITVYGTPADSNEEVEIEAEIFKVNILNLSDNFYIKYTNNVNRDNKTFYYSDALNKTISFDWNDLSKVTTMTFKVYTSNKTNCKDELSRTIYLTLPRYNQYHDWNICAGRDNLSICDKYVTTEEISYADFVNRISTSAEQNNEFDNSTSNESNPTNQSNESNNMYIYIIGGAAAIIIIAVVIVVANRKRNQL